MIVLDASAALEVLLRGPVAGTVLTRMFTPGEALHAPQLIDLEVAQVLRRHVLAGRMTSARGAEALDAPLLTTDAKLARATGHGARVEVLVQAQPKKQANA